jgi:hypothetical protein
MWLGLGEAFKDLGQGLGPDRLEAKWKRLEQERRDREMKMRETEHGWRGKEFQHWDEFTRRNEINRQPILDEQDKLAIEAARRRAEVDAAAQPYRLQEPGLTHQKLEGEVRKSNFETDPTRMQDAYDRGVRESDARIDSTRAGAASARASTRLSGLNAERVGMENERLKAGQGAAVRLAGDPIFQADKEAEPLWNEVEKSKSYVRNLERQRDELRLAKRLTPEDDAKMDAQIKAAYQFLRDAEIRWREEFKETFRLINNGMMTPEAEQHIKSRLPAHYPKPADPSFVGPPAPPGSASSGAPAPDPL